MLICGFRDLMSWLIAVVLLVLNVRYTKMKCIHDEVHPASSTNVNNEDTPSTIPWARRIDRSLSEIQEEEFRPLRIHVHYSPSSVLDKDTQKLLELAVQSSVLKLSTVLSVVPVAGPLLLSRSDACPIVFRSGVNEGKCSRLKKGYRGEFCLDVFRIPDDHLEGVSIYNATYKEPIRNVFKAGEGVQGVDTILYVAAISTKICLAHNQSVIAYASHCRVDQTGRPIAGLVNFCPFTLLRSSPTQEFLYTTALHEILHVLGFSTKLFSTFRECSDGACKTVPAAVRSVSGQLRLATPNVVNMTQRHFNCYTQDDFGGPLQMINSKETSHWDSHMMHTSLMTARDDNTSLVVLDPITLAVFEDSGWYKVNFTNADPFLWGKDSGCSFGLPNQCISDQNHFCSGNSTGCHFFQRAKATCDAQKTGSQCGLFASDAKGSCAEEDGTQADEKNTLEDFSSSSRCFVSSVSSHTSQILPKGFTGQCYSSKCAENGTIFVKLRGTDWIQCPLGQTIQVSGLQGEIQCPHCTGIICRKSWHQQILTTKAPQTEGTTISSQQNRTKPVGRPIPTTTAVPNNARKRSYSSLTSLTVTISLIIDVYCKANIFAVIF